MVVLNGSCAEKDARLEPWLSRRAAPRKTASEMFRCRRSDLIRSPPQPLGRHPEPGFKIGRSWQHFGYIRQSDARARATNFRNRAHRHWFKEYMTLANQAGSTTSTPTVREMQQRIGFFFVPFS